LRRITGNHEVGFHHEGCGLSLSSAMTAIVRRVGSFSKLLTEPSARGFSEVTGLWLDEIVSGSVTDVQQIARRQKCSARQVNMTLSLAFLAPDLVRAAVEGRLPRGIGVERLRNAPAEWSQQFEALGLNPR
jgi:hypothetical protein